MITEPGCQTVLIRADDKPARETFASRIGNAGLPEHVYQQVSALEADNSAENEKLRVQFSGQTCFVPPEFQAEMDGLRARIASLEDKVKVAEEALEIIEGGGGVQGEVATDAIAKLREPT